MGCWWGRWGWLATGGFKKPGFCEKPGFCWANKIGWRQWRRYWIKKPGFLPTGFLGSAKTETRFFANRVSSPETRFFQPVSGP